MDKNDNITVRTDCRRPQSLEGNRQSSDGGQRSNMICRREEEPLVYEVKFYDSLLTFDNDHVKYIAECGYVNGLNVASVF